MSAAESIRLENLLDLDPVECCRFCGCTEFRPCEITIAEDPDGKLRLARSECEAIDVMPCRWYIPGVCNAPRCLEKLIAEWGDREPSRVLLFDASGARLLMSAEDRVKDSAADDRDFNMIGRQLGLSSNEITREAIIERIRELQSGRKRRTA